MYKMIPLNQIINGVPIITSNAEIKRGKNRILLASGWYGCWVVCRKHKEGDYTDHWNDDTYPHHDICFLENYHHDTIDIWVHQLVLVLVLVDWSSHYYHYWWSTSPIVIVLWKRWWWMMLMRMTQLFLHSHSLSSFRQHRAIGHSKYCSSKGTVILKITVDAQRYSSWLMMIFDSAQSNESSNLFIANAQHYFWLVRCCCCLLEDVIMDTVRLYLRARLIVFNIKI